MQYKTHIARINHPINHHFVHIHIISSLEKPTKMVQPIANAFNEKVLCVIGIYLRKFPFLHI